MAVTRRRRRRRNPNPRVRSHYRRTPARRRRRSNPNPNPNPRTRRRYYARARSTVRRRRRRNPPTMRQIQTHLLPTLGWVTAGFMATRVVGNMVTPMLGGLTMGQPIMRMATKLGVAYLGAWLLEMGFGKRVFTYAFVGGSMEVVQDFAKTFIAPMFPMLGAYQEPLEVYYERSAIENGGNGIGAYYTGETVPDVIP